MPKKGGKKNKDANKNDSALMPSLVFNNFQKEDSTNTKSERKKKLQKIIAVAKEREKSRGWMMIGAVGLSVVIVILWGYALINKMSIIGAKKTEEGQLIDKSKDDWNKIFEETKETELQKEVRRLQMQEILKKLTTVETDAMLNATNTPESTETTTTNKNTKSTTSTKK